MSKYKVVDARFKSCPGPLIVLAKAISESQYGEIIVLLATDPAAPADIEEWCRSVGHRLVKVDVDRDVYRIYVEVRR